MLRNDGNKTKTRAILLVGSKVEPSAKLCNINSQLIRYIYIYIREIYRVRGGDSRAIFMMEKVWRS